MSYTCRAGDQTLLEESLELYGRAMAGLVEYGAMDFFEGSSSQRWAQAKMMTDYIHSRTRIAQCVASEYATCHPCWPRISNPCVHPMWGRRRRTHRIPPPCFEDDLESDFCWADFCHGLSDD